MSYATGKRSFPSWHAAARDIRGHGLKAQRRLKPYRCPFCRAFHITGSTRSGR